MKTNNTLIIGAGLTGLSCAYHLQGEYLLVEKENEPGGVVRTRMRETKAGVFACDGTGHWLHLRDQSIRKLVEAVLPDGLVEYERRAVIHLAGCFTAFPFQANTHGLPSEIALDCILGFLQAKHPEDFGLPAPSGSPRNFRESIERLFGTGICRHFMVPYNEKLMGVKLEEIAANYATRFIPRPAVEDVIKGAFGFSREALGYNARFVYPKRGGIGSLPTALAGALPSPVRFNAAVKSIDLKEQSASFEDGSTVNYKHLLNTMPLVSFLNILEGQLPRAIQSAAAKLRSTTVWYFDIGVRGLGGSRSNYHWVYYPEPEYLFYRVGSYSAVHKENAPLGCRSYYVEMSGGLGDLLQRKGDLEKRVLADLRKAKILDDHDEVLFLDLRSIPHAYVIFNDHYESARKEILDWLGTKNILTHGRWGGWNYGGMEDALIEGRQAAAFIEAEK